MNPMHHRTRRLREAWLAGTISTHTYRWLAVSLRRFGLSWRRNR